jgi:23S rRNA-/tRNA-specific pseudouridylate synthase
MIEQTSQIKVPLALDNKRFDKALSQLISIGRKQAQIWIQEGIALYDERLCSPSKKVKSSRIIQLKFKASIQKPLIYLKEKDYLVIEKDPDVVVHEGAGHYQGDTLADWLKSEYGVLPSLSHQGNRGGVVHRLDKPTSGLLILGLTERGVNHFANEFFQRKVKKIYLSLHEGCCPDQGVWKTFLTRSPENPQKRISENTSPHETAKEAETHFVRYLYSNGLSLVLSKPITGRNHQLRAQWSQAGWPILGDTLYDGTGAERLFLHASALCFYEPNNPQNEKIQISLPKNLFHEKMHQLGVDVSDLSKQFINFLNQSTISESVCP